MHWLIIDSWTQSWHPSICILQEYVFAVVVVLFCLFYSNEGAWTCISVIPSILLSKNSVIYPIFNIKLKNSLSYPVDVIAVLLHRPILLLGYTCFMLTGSIPGHLMFKAGSWSRQQCQLQHDPRRRHCLQKTIDLWTLKCKIPQKTQANCFWSPYLCMLSKSLRCGNCSYLSKWKKKELNIFVYVFTIIWLSLNYNITLMMH